MEARLDEQTQLLEQERQRVLVECSRAESLEEERRVMTQQLSVERAELERTKEWAELQIQVCMLRAREEQLARDRELLDKSWQELKVERENVNGAALHVWQQEEEMKSVTELSSQKYKEGERALREALRVESHHQSRLQALQWQLEQVKQQEEHLHQDRAGPAEHGSAEEPASTAMPGASQQPRDAADRRLGLQCPCFPPAISSPGGAHELLARASSAELSATLAMLKFQALQDHAYLDNEQLFLESLKKPSYNAASLPG
ncbi:fas-binding factor 1 homolog isoform X2 [Strix uralensis]|uniref:fas-binding factor 1 homolog isoform X2 n=1 Tax=Strix uralensis TaxID=36305 RepID=UPI003DA71EE7